MCAKHEYRLREAERQRKLAAIRQSQDRSLSEELAVTRLLLQESLDEGLVPQAAALVEVVRRLAIDDAERALKERDLLDRNSVMAIGRAMGSLMADVLLDFVDEATQHQVIDIWVAKCQQLLTTHKETGTVELEAP